MLLILLHKLLFLVCREAGGGSAGRFSSSEIINHPARGRIVRSIVDHHDFKQRIVLPQRRAQRIDDRRFLIMRRDKNTDRNKKLPFQIVLQLIIPAFLIEIDGSDDDGQK